MSAAVIAAVLMHRHYEPVPYPHRHNLILWLLFGWILLWIPLFYFTFSKNHYWYFGPFQLCRTYEDKAHRKPIVIRKGDLPGKGHDTIFWLLISWPFVCVPMMYFSISYKHYLYLGVRQDSKITYLTKTTKIILSCLSILLFIGFLNYIFTYRQYYP